MSKGQGQIDRTIVVLIAVLVIAGVLVAFLMISIADRSAKSIQEIKETKVSSEAVESTFDLGSPRDASEDLDKLISSKQNLFTASFVAQDFTEDSFAKIAQLKKAKILRFRECTFEPKWFEHLQSMTQLRTILLNGSPIDGKGLTAIAKLPEIEVLTLFGAQISDEDLASIPLQAKVLRLTHTHISDKGVMLLPAASALNHLDLSYTQVTDKGLKALSKLKHLTILKLDGTEVTDDGLESLAGMKKLIDLGFDECPHVTTEGVKKLQRALPMCRILLHAEKKNTADE